MIQPGFTLCFLLYEGDVLMLHRRFPPNQGLWNGVGGHIEPGETAREAVIREVKEETGYEITDPVFAGLLTWDGFEIPPGGIAIFIANVPHPDFASNHEGDLAWKPSNWACSAPEVVDNIHVFLPRLLKDEAPQHFHFTYQDGVRIRDRISALPEDFDLEMPYQPEHGISEAKRGEYLISGDPERLQIDIIEEFLAKHTYWGQGRSRALIERSIQNSVCLGIYHHGTQVGFARLVTDQATFGWLCDVFVDEAHRGQGLGKWLVETACGYVDGLGVSQILLATRDAQGLYQAYGDFENLSNPESYLTRIK